MGFFDSFRKRQTPSLVGRAQSLANMAEASAVSSFVPMLDQFPSLRRVDPKRWDQVLTIAGIFVATSRLNQINIAVAERNSLLDIVMNEALQWNTHSAEAFDDCRVFVDRSYDAVARNLPVDTDRSYHFSDALGSWIVWNLFNHAASSDEEWQMVRVLGGAVVHEFYSWWEVNNQ